MTEKDRKESTKNKIRKEDVRNWSEEHERCEERLERDRLSKE
jgi:hypothetical protein